MGNFPELGVVSWRLNADIYETDEELKKIREERGYSYMVCSSLKSNGRKAIRFCNFARLSYRIIVLHAVI